MLSFRARLSTSRLLGKSWENMALGLQLQATHSGSSSIGDFCTTASRQSLMTCSRRSRSPLRRARRLQGDHGYIVGNGLGDDALPTKSSARWDPSDLVRRVLN